LGMTCWWTSIRVIFVESRLHWRRLSHPPTALARSSAGEQRVLIACDNADYRI